MVCGKGLNQCSLLKLKKGWVSIYEVLGHAIVKIICNDLCAANYPYEKDTFKNLYRFPVAWPKLIILPGRY